MNWRILTVLLSLSWACCVEAHVEGPPPKGLTLVSLALSAGGAIMVSATLLALLWKSIDGAFRRSRFRARWENRSTRITFALAVVTLTVVVVGGFTYAAIEKEEHEEHAAGPPALEPMHGGVVMQEGTVVFELVARRTGELRLYLTDLHGGPGPVGETTGQASIVPSVRNSPAETLTLKLTFDGYLAAYALPFQSRQIKVHLSVRVTDQSHELDFTLPVQD